MKGKKEWSLKIIFHNLSRKIRTWRPISAIRWFIRDLIKACQWFVFGFKDQDWDWAYSLRTLEYKADRMLKAFKKCPWHDHRADIKELKEFRDLCKLLSTDYEFDYAYEISNKKWGEYERKTGTLAEDLGGLGYAPKMVKSKADYVKYHNEFKKLVAKGEKLYAKAFCRFVELLKSRSRFWSC